MQGMRDTMSGSRPNSVLFVWGSVRGFYVKIRLFHSNTPLFDLFYRVFGEILTEKPSPQRCLFWGVLTPFFGLFWVVLGLFWGYFKPLFGLFWGKKGGFLGAFPTGFFDPQNLFLPPPPLKQSKTGLFLG